MKSKITKKQAEKIVKRKYGSIGTYDHLGGLCASMPPKLRGKWMDTWNFINVNNKTYASSYLYNADNKSTYTPSSPEITMLRLLTMHMFIEDNY